jgi:hypothetical protein
MDPILLTSPKYHLGKIANKYLILDILFSAFYRQKRFTYLLHASSHFSPMYVTPSYDPNSLKLVLDRLKLLNAALVDVW